MRIQHHHHHHHHQHHHHHHRVFRFVSFIFLPVFCLLVSPLYFNIYIQLNRSVISFFSLCLHCLNTEYVKTKPKLNLTARVCMCVCVCVCIYICMCVFRFPLFVSLVTSSFHQIEIFKTIFAQCSCEASSSNTYYRFIIQDDDPCSGHVFMR